jgi:hypothetical protein
MQKWEYRFVSVQISDDDKYHFLINSKRYGDSLASRDVNERRWKLAEQLGDEGWELVAASHSNSDMIFKRPK